MLDSLQQLYQLEYNQFGVYIGPKNPLTTSTPNNLGLIPNLVTDSVNPGAIGSGDMSTQASLTNGWLQSSNFKTGVTGWQIKSNGDAEFGNGTFRGNISGSTINIPNSSNPLFSVDSSGNVVASSLLRKDFHWFTVFESISGYSVTNGGTGTMVAQDGGLYITSGVVTTNKSTLKKSLSYGVTWNKSRKIKMAVTFGSNINQTIYIVTGSQSAITDRHFGFRVIDSTLKGTCADGTTQITVDLSTSIIPGNFYTLEAQLSTLTNSINFYVNGVLKGSTANNIPTGSTSSDYLIWINFTQDLGADGSKTLQLGYYDFWQAN